MKKAGWIVFSLVLALIVSISLLAEYRYSSDMNSHIAMVNSDIESAQAEAEYSTGLIEGLNSMTDEANVAGEILDTQNHVHTLKDEMLARNIKQAAENGVTVGGAIQSVIYFWEKHEVK